jgi:hypothetical protein
LLQRADETRQRKESKSETQSQGKEMSFSPPFFSVFTSAA